ncbi:hypothetical protein CRG98_001645 [Punica granatum]|uniref:Protein NRT1/ PTR FAMILY 2.10-like n=1 Tax=Punica granatum TaxID=22663 RepID=A0A2I0LBJ1_PUNGR|nr:hypothetical protein CRG98_001645 [Punica granatum]
MGIEESEEHEESKYRGVRAMPFVIAAISKLHPPQCRPGETENCPGPNTWQMLFLLSGFGFLVIGGGGIRPCNLAFGADQFNPNTSSGKRGISSFFNWYYFTFTFAMMVSLTGIVYVQSDVSWAWGLAIPAFLISLDKAAIITPDDKFNEDGSGASPWRLCSIQQVEEVKCLVRTLPIWTTSIIYYVTLVQQQTYTIFQALQMDRRLGPSFKIPAASYTVFSMVALTIWIPIYDQILVPALRKITGKEGGITVLQKMGIGVFLAIVTMSVSGFVEGQRRSLALKNPIGVDPIRGSISSLSGLWLVPQLVLGGLSEAFTVIAQVEFNYKQFPENMRSIGGSLLFVGFAVSSYLSSLLISIIHHTTKGNKTEWLPQDLNKGRLDYFYYLVAALEVVNLGYFIICARWYKYKGSSEGRIIEEVNVEKVQTGKELTL